MAAVALAAWETKPPSRVAAALMGRQASPDSAGQIARGSMVAKQTDCVKSWRGDFLRCNQ